MKKAEIEGQLTLDLTTEGSVQKKVKKKPKTESNAKCMKQKKCEKKETKVDEEVYQEICLMLETSRKIYAGMLINRFRISAYAALAIIERLYKNGRINEDGIVIKEKKKARL